MKAYITKRPMTDELDVTLIERHSKGKLCYFLTPEGWQFEEVAPGAEIRPAFRIPTEWLEEIIRASEGHVHPQQATVLHLEDAIGVRDRLLKIIEQKVGLRSD